MSDPQPFGKYQLLERIATGGMAEIYRARFEAGHGVAKTVVIKKILPHYGAQPNFVKMFINEAKIVTGLSHGNIAQVFDFGEVNGDYFLAMEFVHGQPLSKVLRRAAEQSLIGLPLPFAVQIAIEICKGLHYAHTRLDESGRPQNIIHRDVSPQNILVSYEGSVKLVDFGIAKARGASSDGADVDSIKGKYLYFSSEQARGRELDSRTDVFSAGAVLYEMVCGRLPFEGSMLDVVRKIISGQLTPPSAANPVVPAELQRIILKAMASDRRERHETAQYLQDSLAAWLAAAHPSHPPSALTTFMGYLFEKELVDQGLPVRIPPDFHDKFLARPPPAPVPTALQDTGVLPRTADVKRTPVELGRRWLRRTLSRVPLERLSIASLRKLPPQQLRIVLPAAAAVLAGLLVFTFGYCGNADLEVTSDPPGAAVLIDGKRTPKVTPTRIDGLDPDVTHMLQLEAPGMRPWSGKLDLQPGSTLPVHAKLEPEHAP